MDRRKDGDKNGLRSNLEEPDWGFDTVNPKWCKSCAFSHGKPPYADWWRKGACVIYDYKPYEVYHHGAKCPSYLSYDDAIEKVKHRR